MLNVTKLQHVNTHYGHIRTRGLSPTGYTDYHRPRLTARASVRMSKNRPLRGATAHSPENVLVQISELAAPKSRLVVACGGRKAGVSSPCTNPGNGGRLDEAGVKWVESLLVGG